MQQFFERDGIRFQYPNDWTYEIETEGDSWTASLQSPDTAFLVISYVPGVDDPTDLVDAAVAGLRAEYQTLDTEDAVDTIGGLPAVGVDINFVHLDLTNTCWVRSVQAADGALLVLAECADGELEDRGTILKAIVASIALPE